MSSGIFGIAISGLSAAQAGLATTGHNISNASTEGYHRQSAVQRAAVPLETGAGFLGQGVEVSTVRRIYSEHLDGQVGKAEARAAYFSAYDTEIAQIDNLLTDAQSGMAPVLQGFFGALNDVATDPSSLAARQSLLSAGSSLETRFRALDNRLSEIRSGVNQRLSSTVGEINTYATQIAGLNARMLAVEHGSAQPANDLQDQRDALVSKLNQLAGATSVRQDDGSINVFIGTGQNLVVGAQAFQLKVIPSLDDPGSPLVGYDIGTGLVRIDPRSLNGGALGGLLAFRGDALNTAQNELGRIAAGLAQSFNAAHQAGQDLTGALGGAFFSQPQPSVQSRSGNAGNAVLSASITDANALTTSDYRLTVGGGSYSLTRLSDNVTTSYASLPQTVDGMSISVGSGTPANGDVFLIQPVRNAAGQIHVQLTDPAQVAAAAPIRTAASIANSGNATLSGGAVTGVAPLNANLQQAVTLTFTGAGTFNVSGVGTGNPSGVAYTSGADISYNGWTVRVSGTPQAGDTFTVTPNSGGTADGRNAARLAGLQTARTLGGGTATYQDTYGQLVSSTGNKAREIQVSVAAQENIATQVRQTQQSLSGVNLDEEAANLLRYQQAYQASAKLIQAATTVFDTLISLGGR